MVARFPGTTSQDLAVLHGYALPLYPGLLPPAFVACELKAWV